MEHPGVATGARAAGLIADGARADDVRAAGAAAGGIRPAAATTGVFLQVRLGSRRLPRKALLPLGDSTVIRQAMRALRRVPAGVHALLTDAGSAAALAESARLEGFTLFIGPEEDVLRRFADARRAFGVDTVVRATGDNPLVSAPLAERILALHAQRGADLSHFLGIPLGTGVEVVAASALLAADRESADPYEREHVTPFLYRRRGRFRVEEPEGPAACLRPGARVTLDTEEDYGVLQALYRELYRGRPLEAEEVAAWLGR